LYAALFLALGGLWDTSLQETDGEDVDWDWNLLGFSKSLYSVRRNKLLVEKW
jgi:hypothetical protein